MKMKVTIINLITMLAVFNFISCIPQTKLKSEIKCENGKENIDGKCVAGSTTIATTFKNCGNTIHGKPINQIRYKFPTVPNGSSCSAVLETQTATCDDGIIGSFSGTFQYANCFVEGQTAHKDKLLLKDDFIYLGAFKVPTSDMGGPRYHGMSYGGSVIAFNEEKNSLFIVGHAHDQMVAEISIPQPVISIDLNDLNRSEIIQNLHDITEGNRDRLCKDGGKILVNGTKIGGLIRYGDKLIGSSYAYYDGGYHATRSHFKSGLNLAEDDFEGMYEVGSKPNIVPQAGFIAGYMTIIPTNWQQSLGGTVLSGMSALSILGRTSSGSAAFSFNPDNLSGNKPASASALLCYPIDHQTIGTYYTSKTLYNKGTHHSGVIFPSGSRTILYTGRQGIGDACYGPGTNIEGERGNRYNLPAPHNTCRGVVMTNTADPCCYDPTNFNKGSHAYPYVTYAWAYDAADFKRVKDKDVISENPSPNLVDGISVMSNETYKPWHIKPYAHWKIDLNFPDKSNFNGASAYDSQSKKLYLVQKATDRQRPIIHVFSVNLNISAQIK